MLTKYTNLINQHSGNAGLFLQELEKTATRLGVPARWIADVIYVESGFNPKAKNPHSTASGLIQFIEATARELGTSTSAIRAMSNIQQLSLIERYFANWFARLGKPSTGFDLYLLVFYPALANKPDDDRLPNNAYAGNKAMDTQGKGYITKRDIRTWFGSRLGKKLDVSPTLPKTTLILLLGAGAVFALSLYKLF